MMHVKHVSSVGKQWMTRVLGWSANFSPHHNVKTSSKTRTASYPAPPPTGNAADCDHSPLSCAEIKNTWQNMTTVSLFSYSADFGTSQIPPKLPSSDNFTYAGITGTLKNAEKIAYDLYLQCLVDKDCTMYKVDSSFFQT